MESGGFPSGRRRRFDAHDLVLLGQIFDVPVVYFFLPQPGTSDIEERLRGLLGRAGRLDDVDDRLNQLGSARADQTIEILAGLEGVPSHERTTLDNHYREWRSRRLAAIEELLGDDTDTLADVLGGFAAAIKGAGPHGFLRHFDEHLPPSCHP